MKSKNNKRKIVTAKELTGMISNIKGSSLQAQKKAVELFGKID